VSLVTKRVLAVALWLWLASFTFLGLDHAIGDGDECVHATILRDMLRAGDWLAPRYLGDLVLERPLLPYWLAAPFSLLVPDEVGIRLSSALCSFATLIVVFVAARSTWKRTDAAFVAVLLLAGSPSFHAYSRTLMSEPPLLLFLAIAVACALRLREDPRWLVGVALGLGLGIATKSLVVGVPALALAPWLVSALRRADRRTLLRAALVLAVTALPYYVLKTALHGETFLRAHFGLSLASRASGNYGIGIAGGSSAYLRWVPETEGWVTASWLLLGTFGALGFGLYRRRLELVMLASYALGLVVLLSLLATRLPHYILPAYSAAALGVAGLYAAWSEGLGLERRAFGVLLGPILAMVVLIEGRLHPGDLYLFQRPWGRDLGWLATQITKPGETLYAHEWKATSLRYYSERPIVFTTADRRRYEVVKNFVKGLQLVPPAPAPVGSVIYVAGEAPVITQTQWLHVEEVLGASPPMFLVRARVTSMEAPPPPPAQTTPGAAPP
jgi:4-amino-4-deoxy-L-arabinose transferase-like glycosyltransferase